MGPQTQLFEDLQAQIESQEQLIMDLATDPAYNIMTRTGLERLVWPQVASMASDVVFADIDGMKQLNERYGQDQVNQMIEQALHCRSEGNGRLPDVGRWFSGDEILWIMCDGNPIGLAKSVLRKMQALGFSATFGIARVTSPVLQDNVKMAMERVHRAKLAGQRGSINL